MLDERGLLQLKSKIDEAKAQTSKLEGRRDHLLEQLRDEWKCPTVAAAEKEVARMDRDLADLDKRIAAGAEKCAAAMQAS